MAQYTTLDQIDPADVAHIYALNDPKLTPLAGGAANSSFRLVSNSGDFVLTILDNHDTASAERLAAHTRALRDLGVPTSTVVPAPGGALITHLNGRPMVLKEWIAGEVRQPLPVTLLPEAGSILARLHTLSPQAPGLGDVPVGRRRLSPEQESLIDHFSDVDFATWLTQQLGRIRAAEAKNARARTLVHGDLFDDNMIVRPDGRLTVLDWETISLDDPLLDLGMAAVGLAQEDGALSPERLHALVTGYEQIIPLSDDDVADLPTEITHAAVIIAFHRYYRHNIRFPDASRSSYHLGMIKFVDSVAAATQLIR